MRFPRRYLPNPIRSDEMIWLGLGATALVVGLVALASRSKSANAASKPIGSWRRVTDLTLRPGRIYRLSAVKYVNPTPEQLDAWNRFIALWGAGDQPVTVIGEYNPGAALPPDWPSDDIDQNPNRGRLEFQTGSNFSPVTLPPIGDGEMRLYQKGQ